MTQTTGASLVLLCGVAAGCGQTAPKPANEHVQNKAVPAPPEPVANHSGGEVEARTAVKAALDSWAFGDTKEKFTKDHPDVNLGDLNRITKRLARYEIGTVRKDGNVFEFLVTFTFTGEPGGVTRT